MKRYIMPLMLFFSVGCQSSEKIENKPLPAKDLLNVAYGQDTEQVMDVYLPAGRNTNTNVFILVHGGGWSGGSKSDFNYVVPILKAEFPDYAIVNLNYRLATAKSPAFPKQIQDIEKAVAHLQQADYNISNNYAFIGASAGAHLAMLYSYKYDVNKEVKALANIVGPADFSDPYYTSHPYYNYAAMYLLGDMSTSPDAALSVSPVAHVTAGAPATALFYGAADPVVPASQAERLKAKLDAYNVPNEYYLFQGAGHGGWNKATTTDFQEKLISFFKKQF